MKQFTPLLCITLLFLSGALSSVPPRPPPPLIPEDCNATEFQAGLALEEINKDRDEGYVFSMYRVADAHRQAQGAGNIYYFTIDVLETDCHIVSRKSWKDCTIEPFHNAFFGQCKAVFYLSLPWRRAKLYSYNCILGHVSTRLTSHTCPDCLSSGKDVTSYGPLADMMVAKYNRESNNTHVYKVYMVESSYTQWMNGPSHFVDIVIKETNCSEVHETECHFLEDEKAHVGFCKGTQISRPGDDSISVSCEIYEHKKLGLPRFRKHEHHGEDHGNVHIYHDHQYDTTGKIIHVSDGGKDHHKENHEQKDEHESRSGEPQNHPAQKHDGGSSAEHAGRKPVPPPPRGPIGSVEYYDMKNETDGFPSPSNPGLPQPIVVSGSPPVQEPVESEQPVGPVFIGPFEDPEPQPFPLHPSDSPGCPSHPKHKLPHIASLL